VALLFCTLCEHRWDQTALEMWLCPKCEMASAPMIVVDATNDEIADAWSFFNSFPLFAQVRQLVSEGHSTYFNVNPREGLSPYLDFLVLAFDRVFLPDIWEYVDKTNEERLLYYYDAGALIPVDRGTLSPWITVMGEPRPSDLDADISEPRPLSFEAGLGGNGQWVGVDPRRLPPGLEKVERRVLETGRFINLSQFQRWGSGGFPISLLDRLENFIKILSHLDVQSQTVRMRDLVAHLAAHDQYEYEGRPNFFFLTKETLPNPAADVYALSRLNHLNAQVMISQLSAVPLLVDPTLGPVLRWKFGGHESTGEEARVSALRTFANALGISFPRGVDHREVIKLRDSTAGAQLRSVLADAVKQAREDQLTSSTEVLRREYDRALAELAQRATRLGDVVSLSITGSASTAGSILGGPVGAVIGGAGGAVVGYGAKIAAEAFYKVVKKNWAFYFATWGKK